MRYLSTWTVKTLPVTGESFCYEQYNENMNMKVFFGFSTILGLAFGYTRVKTQSSYPAIILHALFNLAGTL
jgi:membrane protease YdiL (CAAX protease family)